MPVPLTRLAAFAALLLALAVPASAADRYVDASVGASGDGMSWAAAYRTLSEALGVAQAGDIVRVAEGVYTPSAAGERTASFVVPTGVQLLGGYAAGGGSRDLAPDDGVTDTILSGEIQGDGAAENNSYHVVSLSGVPAMTSTPGTVGYTRVESVTIKAGNANGGGFDNGGGGLLCSGRCSPDIRQVAFTDNRANSGGAVYFAITLERITTRPLLTDVTFARNRATTGGAVAIAATSIVTLEPAFVNATFSENIASQGGAIYVFGGRSSGVQASFANVVFDRNTAEQAGGAVYSAADIRGGSASVSVVQGTFSGNVAPTGGAYTAFTGVNRLTLSNVVAWGNGESSLRSGTDASIQRSLIEGGCPSGVTTCTGFPGDGTLDVDPLFADAASGDLTTAEGSPARDAGDATLLPLDVTDLDGDGNRTEALPLDLARGPRVLGAAVDLGAFESLAPVASEAGAAAAFALSAPRPNPARAGAQIPFSLAESSAVRLSVTDLLGREVARLVDGARGAGAHTEALDASRLAPGVYVVRLVAGNEAQTQRLVVVR